MDCPWSSDLEACSAWLPWKMSRLARRFQLCGPGSVSYRREWWFCYRLLSLLWRIVYVCFAKRLLSFPSCYFIFSFSLSSAFYILSLSGASKLSGNTRTNASADRRVSSIFRCPYFFMKKVPTAGQQLHQLKSNNKPCGVDRQLRLQHGDCRNEGQQQCATT